MIVDAVDRYIALIRAGGGLYREVARQLVDYAAFAHRKARNARWRSNAKPPTGSILAA